MNQHLIFQYTDKVTFGKSKEVITAIFISQANIDQNGLAQEINEFYREHGFADKILVLLPSYASEASKKMFTESRDKTFARVPGRSNEYLEQSLLIYEYLFDGKVQHLFGKPVKEEQKFIKHLFRNGSAIIFKNYGGLVESSPDHHFVFPSKKHCNKFIRSANVLVNSHEIFFLALQLLPVFDSKKVIYCDTSSISSLAYAVFELKRRFKIDFDCPIVNSFSSYEVFESNTRRFSDDTLLLISSSTSGNIIERLLDQKLAERDQIVVLYFLGPDKAYQSHASNIICNLTCDSETFDCGIEPFNTFDSEDTCQLCRAHSRAVYISSDVFLTIQPKIQKVLLAGDDAPKWLSPFVQHYKCSGNSPTVLKNYYKEDDPNADYEIFIDTINLFSNIDAVYTHFRSQLDRLINKYIPANVGCFVHLIDKGSKQLAEIIKARTDLERDIPIIPMKGGFEDDIPEGCKCAVIVASSVVMGKQFLHVSRILRKYPDMGIIYFVGVLRTIYENDEKTLRSNLGRGQADKGISDSRPLYPVESIFCTGRKTRSSWYEEKLWMEEVYPEIDEESEVGVFINQRINTLRDNKQPVGLSTNVFLSRYDGEPLLLRKNFAFFNFGFNDGEIVQSEVFFTISSILTSLESKSLTERKSLKQSHYVRNLLHPANFQRFNDGIIQACLLRSGKPDFFAYDLEPGASLEMKIFLLTVIAQYDTAHGEALLEFLLAIALRKLRLRKEDLREVLRKSVECPNQLIAEFSKLVTRTVAGFETEILA